MSKTQEKDCADSTEVSESCGEILAFGSRGINMQAVDMNGLVGLLQSVVDRPVVNETGLEGLYDIKADGWVRSSITGEGLIHMTPRPPEEAPVGSRVEESTTLDPAGRTLFNVLEEDLGLKLVSKRALIETFIVDRAERPSPSPN